LNFLATPLVGIYVIELEPLPDARSYFAGSYYPNEFERFGIEASVARCNVLFNAQAGTLRGLYRQASPHKEAKLARSTEGAMFDIAVDICRDSVTYLKGHAVELTRENRRWSFIPRGFAHGFGTWPIAQRCFIKCRSFTTRTARAA
jgi:dTDP-4-dehydrorhamnose 3,5-epimerase